MFRLSIDIRFNSPVLKVRPNPRLYFPLVRSLVTDAKYNSYYVCYSQYFIVSSTGLVLPKPNTRIPLVSTSEHCPLIGWPAPLSFLFCQTIRLPAEMILIHWVIKLLLRPLNLLTSRRMMMKIIMARHLYPYFTKLREIQYKCYSIPRYGSQPQI